MRGVLKLALVGLLVAVLLPAATAAAPVAVQSKNFEHQAVLPSLTGASMAFFERSAPGGAVRRYAAVGVMGYGVEFVDITTPSAPVTVGRYLTPGVNYHTDVQINSARDIMVLSVDSPGVSVAQGIGPGIELVDIRDLSAAARLSVVPGLEGPHKLALIGDAHIYTALPTYIIDYSDPRSPKNLGRADAVCAHGVALSPTDPTTAYIASCSSFRWQVVDVSDPANPVIRSEVRDLQIQTPHDAIPSPDGSIVAVSDLRGDYYTTQCPGGGIHFFDVSGRYIQGASEQNPRKLGTWFPPFTGARNDPAVSDPYGSCTLHGYQVNPERFLLASASYMAGGWVADFEHATRSGGFYPEYRATPGSGLGPTTWGNSMANWLSPVDFTWYLKWAPFDDPVFERTMFSVSPVHGFEVLRYTGPLPAKLADLRVDGTAPDGVVTGRLGRYPLLTADGWVSRPLAGALVEVTAGGRTVQVRTDDDGRFAADLDLPTGSRQATASWAGDDAFRATTRSATVVVP